MNRIRKLFADEVEALAPVLHETYRRIGILQKNRTVRNESLVLTQLETVAPHLSFFCPYVPPPKQPYFAALADPSLDVSDRIIALDVAVGALHIDFPVERAYMHRESAALRQVLERARFSDDPPDTAEPGSWLSGIGASPGVVTAPAHVATRTSDFRRVPDGSVLVTTAPRPEIIAALPAMAGLVAERGGRLSHAAIVARELGVPCVVGAANATRRIRSGQRITMDGGSGRIERA
ncbi:MAG TPA: PEP-utilizing enzyme [Acidimicrobiia bacterium]|jgi:phosphohistidine swiveling domain-containing protein|nr:PEP-utilizing enzyme [Acidimicrobiia bacterium]